jgi:hypothetical protein
MKKWLFCIALFAFMAPSAFPRDRGFYIDMGLGFGGISYFGGTKDFVDSVGETAEGHSTVDWDAITIGWAATQNLYIVGTISAVWDGFKDDSKFPGVDVYSTTSDVFILTYGIGTRYYPFERFLQLGLDLGASRLSTSDRDVTSERDTDGELVAVVTEYDYTSDFGFAAKLFIGFDFDPSPTGFTGILGGSLMLNVIEGEPILAYMVSFKLAFK